MAFKTVQELPTPEEIKAEYKINGPHHVADHRREIENIIAGNDKRLLMVVGPCSAWPSEAVLEYSDRLARLQDEVRDQLLLIMRVYIQKPRTTVGWPGPLNQPDPLGKVDIAKGIRECRKMMVQVAEKLPIADEMLFTHNEGYFADALSYLAIGARSAEDMEHRYIASGLDVPAGIKNATSGDIKVGVNGVLCAQQPHQFALNNRQVETTGNPFAHLILRGGGGKTNYDKASVANASEMLHAAKVKDPAIVIDVSHDNTLKGNRKNHSVQAITTIELTRAIAEQREEYGLVRGFMIESFLQDGNQPIGVFMSRDGLSITDACLGWDLTQRTIRDSADLLAKR